MPADRVPARVSADRADPAFRPDYCEMEVWLDGVRQTRAVVADAALGECVLLGDMNPNRRGYQRITVRGAVEIKRRAA
jgi:hypothetical protein